ncbi:MAG: divalent metal cation transporter [Alphaproteobacteria bacterium]|jgi:NRAMP (natural resistance-associated macrophage protein)-like metal ion transporter|nr:divalent metal cation transporter [Alphaproteobacteria bacterium]
MSQPAAKTGLKSRLHNAPLLEKLGPGLITGAADDDPSGIATYSQGGAQFGFNLLWTMLLTFPLMVAIQMISALIGRVTGRGLAHNMGQVMPRGIVHGLLVLLFIANTINVGADLAAMGEAAKLVTGLNQHASTIFFAFLSLGLQMFIPYRRYSRILSVLTFSLFAYVAILFLLPLDWKAIGAGLIGLHPDLTESAATTIVAIFGTTISPYLFFWQSAQEVEEVDQRDDEHPLMEQPDEAPEAVSRIRIDTIAGMLASNLIALAIMITTAATLHQHGVTNINTAADAAKALQPIAGQFAFALFAVGIIGTGLLAIPVLAGSTGYAVAESYGWKTGLDNMPWQARGFYGVIAAAVVLGLGIDYSGLDPIKALYWSAVLNGLIAVPMMAALMVVAGSKKKMGDFRVGPVLGGLGWLSTAVMAAAAITMIYVSL